MSQRDDAEGFHCHSFGLATAISNPMGHLPAAVGAFFNAASKAGYRVREGKEQVMLFAASGAKVGGWNKRWGHWYVSRVIAEGRDALMLRHGFEFRDRTADSHCWWQSKGAGRAEAFRRVCEALTGDRVGRLDPCPKQVR